MQETIAFTLNGRPVSVPADGSRKLLWVLRGELALTGAKYGCGAGQCGACTVVLDGKAVRSCQVSLSDVRGRSVVTIEGLAQGDRLHPLQELFVEHGALQCGFCTPGMILNAYALLLENPRPTREQLVSAMDRNLCRCAAHRRILTAIEAVAAKG